ncbi:FtsK DNA segregation ATPase FtsK/SpoIIIE and related proteins [Burkholderiales bacterium]
MPVLSDSPKRRPSATRKKPSAATSSLAPAAQALFADMVWMVWLAISILILLSLLSFSPQDSGWFQTSTVSEPQNWFGRLGATLADLLLFLMGGSALWLGIFGIYMTARALRAAQGRRQRHTASSGIQGGGSIRLSPSQWLGFLLVLIFSATLEAQRGMVWGMLEAFPGGALGSFVGGVLEWALGPTGLTLVGILGFFMGFGMFFGFAWIHAFEWLGRQAETLALWVRSQVEARRDRRLGESTAEERASRLQRKVVERKERAEPLEVIPAVEVQPSPKIQTPPPAIRQPVLFEELTPSEAGLPGIGLLDPIPEASESVSAETLTYTSGLIESRLADFGVQVKVVSAQPGPVITRYEIEPALGVKGSQIVNLAKDLARALSLVSVRVVETIPGKNLMGLELPNPRRQTVRLSEILSSKAFQDSGAALPLALGKDIAGAPTVVDLAKMPHLLVAGTTGSGKSVGVNAMLLSLLYHAPADRVRLILIDPKMLELAVYEGIPHLLTPVVTDMKLAANALHWCVGEMERRYRLMSKLNTRNLAGFNNKVEEALRRGQPILNPLDHPEHVEAGLAEPLAPLPHIVVVIDELADLMMVVGKKVEELIARLAQKARAAGIHLILATQRPSVDVITGLIKANIPSRISFQVSSRIDSRTILDQMGAEALLGMGDMLFMASGSGLPQRVHGAFVADEEVVRVVNHLREQGGAQYNDSILEGATESGGSFTAGIDMHGEKSDAGGEADGLYDEAVAIVLKHRRASISLVQRHLRIGYNRAARLLEAMEQAGVVSPMQSNGNRDILVPSQGGG